MDEKLDHFLHGLEISLALSAIDYILRNLNSAGLDFGFGDAFVRKTIFVVLGKIQAALIKASGESAKNGIVMGEYAATPQE